ncbi:hypothetical protein MJO28_016524 [Puccinia striiformis f. sp. tritici]|uniref:Uncharacterized protein n=2 Tax=Puccinia striiformis TaxID=27350 RepID=A0A2S4VS25_9BASI|nr:hypothetical protein MJO29_016115 [Puccinia striiformis f. sp. tritici]KAI7935653.1 hypothetical protein MJO28_016524 [Puccinia striiformis f. sp. tritici]POW12210.1 hypothetical protein PSTT_04727 [Puccinia striiformis]
MINSNLVYPNIGNPTAEEERETPNTTYQSTDDHEINRAASHLSLQEARNPELVPNNYPNSPNPLFNSPQPQGTSDDQCYPAETLPTYGELADQEGHRFGKWRGWIEKRAHERAHERTMDRQEAELQGRQFGSSWDLPQSNQNINQSQPASLDRNSSIISARDERAAFKSASRNHKDAFLKNHRGKFDGSTSGHRPNLELGPGVVNLTPSTSIHQIGSRFLPQFPSQPLCAIPLPLSKIKNHASTSEPAVERFLLVGTIEGLYVCDLMPSLSSTVKKDMVSPTDSKIYQLWRGLGVHQLEIAIEDTPPTSNSSLPGIVIALTSSPSESIISVGMDGINKSIKMWPMQSMINLVKFRAFSENSECLDLEERSTSNKRNSALDAIPSTLAGLKSMFEKGKHKAGGSISSFSNSFSNASPSSNPNIPTRQQSRDPYVHKPLTTSPLMNPSSPSPSYQKSPNQSHLELPLQWAKQTISLNLPRIQANGPILFIKLSNSPVPGLNPVNDQIDQINDSKSIPAGLRSRSRARTVNGDDGSDDQTPNDGWWYLIIATKQVIFVMDSQPAPQRTWQLCAEMTAPFTAKTAHLVLSEFSRSNNMSKTPSHARTSTVGRKFLNPRLGYGELAVLLTMKEYAVVISLSDLSVRELDLQGTVAASQTTTNLSSQKAISRPSTGSFSGLSHLERVQNNFKPFGRNTSSIGGSIEPVLINKRVKDGFGLARDEGFQVENRRTSRLVSDRRWAGCEELLIPVPSQANHSTSTGGGGDEFDKKEDKHHLRSIYLVTRGYLTYAVICPFGYESRPRSSPRDPSSSCIDQHAGLAGGLPPPLLLKPIHTFTWRAIPIKVQAQIIPTPSKWARVEEKEREPTEGDQSSSNSSGSRGNEVFCCLTAFTASSVEVQEGFISLKFLRMMWEAGKVKEHQNRNLCFFTPASSSTAYRKRMRDASSSSHTSSSSSSSSSSSNGNNKDRNEEEEELTETFTAHRRGPSLPPSPRPPPRSSSSTTMDHQSRSSISETIIDQPPFEENEEELNDNSSYDYSAKIGYLCSSAAWFSASSSSLPPPHLKESKPILPHQPHSFDSNTSENTINDHLPPHHHQQSQQQQAKLGIGPTNNNRQFINGSFFWKQAVGDWKIMYVCSSSDA